MTLIRCFSAVLVLAFISPRSVVCQDEPKITTTIWPEIKRIGMTGYLNCTVTRQSNNKVQWILKATHLVLTSDDRIEIDNSINEIVDGYTKYDITKRENGDESTYMLIVRRLVLSDSGIYTCQINVKAAPVYPSKDGTITVLVPPTIIQGQTTQTVNVDEGFNATLTCAAIGYPNPNISWVRVNGQTLPPPYNRYAVKGNILQLYNMQAGDRGMYRCVADNNVRPLATYDTTVYVFFKPVAKAVQRSYGQAQNRLFDLTFECIVAGYPAPNMMWYHIYNQQTALNPVIDDDKHIINQLLSHGQVLSMAEVWYQMTIINVQANDYGIYVCEGTNRLGSDQLNITIYETSECQGPNCPAEGGQVGAGSRLFSVTSSLLAPCALLLTVCRMY
jgi:limbic system-associated membrane protein